MVSREDLLAELPEDFDPERLYTTREVHAMTGIPTPTLHGWAMREVFVPDSKIGRNHAYLGETILKMMEYRVNKDMPMASTRPGSPSHALAAASVTSLAEVREAEVVVGHDDGAGHRFWYTGNNDGGVSVKRRSFGPFVVDAVLDNTDIGQARVPYIDPNYVFSAGEAVVLANALVNAENTWIYGPTGSGKTSGVRQICAMLNWPMWRVNMSGNIGIDDFLGTTQVEIDEHTGNAVTRFKDGPLIEAMLHGGVLLIDEFTATPSSVMMLLQAVLERPPIDVHELWSKGKSHAVLVNTSNGGEVIHAHPRFRIIVTDNTNGQGDVTGSFAGTHAINEAQRNRFTQWFYKDYPDETTWVKMLQDKTGVSATTAKSIVAIAREVNKGSAQLGASTVTSQLVISPRNTLDIARLYRSFKEDLAVAFNVAMVYSIHPSDPDRQFLKDLLKGKLGT